MNNVEKEILKDYAKAKQDLALAEESVNSLKPLVVQVLTATEGSKAEIPEGKFSLNRSVTYKYSDKVTKVEKSIKEKSDAFNAQLKEEKDLLKNMQEGEVLSGVAEKVAETFIPVWKAVKNA